jgi:hypothetical protein
MLHTLAFHVENPTSLDLLPPERAQIRRPFAISEGGVGIAAVAAAFAATGVSPRISEGAVDARNGCVEATIRLRAVAGALAAMKTTL